MPVSKRDNKARVLALEVLHFCSPERTYPTPSAFLVSAAEDILLNDTAEMPEPEPTPVLPFDSNLGHQALADLRAELAAGPNRKIHAIKAIRALFGSGLRDSKVIAEVLYGEYRNAHGTLQNALDKGNV